MSLRTDIESPVWMEKPPVKETELNLPDWYIKYQKDAWERFQEIPLPTRTDEDWRYADLKKSRFESLYPVQSTSVRGTLSPVSFEKVAAKFVFANGELVESNTDGITGDIICEPIEEAIANHSDQVKPYFNLDTDRLGDEKFAALNDAATKYGLYIKAPKNTEVNGHILVHHYIQGDAAPVFPRTIVVAEANSKVQVVETFHSIDEEEPGLAIGICDLHADDGGKVEHTLVQDLNSHSKQIHLANSHTGKDSMIQSVIVNLGGAWTRNESINRMTASGADTRLFGANLANELQEFDQRTLQIHDAQHTTSDLMIKNALYDKSRVIFGGLIQVLPNAHHTDSYQSCKNLLGSDEAEVNAMPGLEIDADQVRCSHGATSGQISDDEIFYLKSRGIPTEEARRIVSCGFLLEAFERMEDKEVVEWLASLIEDKFDRV